ncbi:MAG TPA: PAS domain S-box protein, partial [Mucilaginibacter sp.]|nr:PAS domain S-box protein [Mucilaginibacter sp.]
FDEELAATNEELTTANEELVATNEELEQTQESLAELNRELENIVILRTKALRESEQKAQALNEKLATVNEELATTNEELSSTNEELSSTNEELVASNEELAQSREEIIKSERLFKSIALNIPKSLIVVIAKNYSILAMEGDLRAQMGFNAGNNVGKHASEVVPPDRYAATKALYDRVLAGEDFTISRKGPDNEEYRVQFVPLRNEGGEVYAGLVIALDITDIRQAEEKAAKLAAIVMSSDDAIISKTLQGIVTSWNASAERIFGYTEKEMIGEPILKIIPQDRLDEEPLILERLGRGERVDHFETKRMTKDGKLLDISLTISPIRDGEGNIIGASKIARDISEQKRDEQRKNDFIGMVSHELKTPLTSLTAVVQLLQIKLKGHDDTFVANSMKNAGRQVKKMADLINGFLNISRLESGKMPMIKREFVLNDLIKENIEETRLMGPDHNIQFHCGEHMIVYADRDKIGSVVLNLLNNAVKYSAKASRIDVNCKIINNRVQITVQDQGIGIEPNDLEKLFDRYYRVESVETQHISGFGIGLYLSSEIIKQHGGNIWAESEPGKGSAFHFALPLKA